MSEFLECRRTVRRSSTTHKEYEKNEANDRKRSILYLIHGYLRDNNLQDSADAVCNEAQLNDYEVCDNVDLDIILQDYQSYYQTKFSKLPKIIRKLAKQEGNKIAVNRRKPLQKPRPVPTADKEDPSSGPCGDFQIAVTCLGAASRSEHGDDAKKPTTADGVEVPRPSLCCFEGYSPEWREMAELITAAIVPKKMGHRWTDCVGMRHVVERLKEAIVYPLDYPHLFTGLLTPWKGILLYGPPGTGKTHTAKALAGETRCTFINFSISMFVSKWRGDSEKMLKVLFDVARLYAPTTIFIDELDALVSKREDNQHEASQRFRSELLIQLDGILSQDEHIFVLATTNAPWNLCSAVLRRFEKRILLGLPTAETRADLFEHYLERSFKDAEFVYMASQTPNRSCADIRLLCKEVRMCSLREKLSDAEKYEGKSTPLRNPTMEDFRVALKKVRPSNSSDTMNKYIDWSDQHGSI